MEEKTFVTRYKGLELVHTPMGLKNEYGSKVPSVRCSFKATTQGYVYTTKDPKMIEWLENHEYMLNKKIQVLDLKDMKKAEAVEVSRKGVVVGAVVDAPEVKEPLTGNKVVPHKVKIRK